MNAFPAIFIGLMLTQLALRAQTGDEGEFQLIKQSGEISLYERWIDLPGEEDKQAREVKGVFYYNSSMIAGLHLLQDESKAMKWQDHVSEFRLFPQRDTTLWYEYSYHDIPWPVSDQDHFMEYRVSSCDRKQMLIAFRSLVNEKLAPERKGVTRITLKGSWHLEQITETRVKVTYRIFSLPSGIPRMLTDPIVRTNIVSTIEDFVAMVEKP
jgi:hypothetical protein